MAVNTGYLTQLDSDYSCRLRLIEQALYRWVDNPRSWQQVKKALEELGRPNVPTTEAAYLEEMLDTEPEDTELNTFLNLMLFYRKEQKTHGTYIKGIRDRLIQGRIHPTFLLHGTITGRLSCRNPNLQNVTRGSELRNLFIPSDGRTFVQADFSQAELRVVCCLARDEYLRERFTSGADIHAENAEKIFGPGFTKEQRVFAKRVVFGLAYNLTAYGLSKQLHIPTREAEKYLAAFNGLIPDTVRWKGELRKFILNNDNDLVTPFGRHRRHYLITPENQKDVINEGTAFLPQSIASDICLSSLIRLHKHFQQTGSTRIVLTVHDSILVECEPGIVDSVSADMKEIMQQTAVDTFSDYVPFPVDISTGPSWGVL